MTVANSCHACNYKAVKTAYPEHVLILFIYLKKYLSREYPGRLKWSPVSLAFDFVLKKESIREISATRKSKLFFD